MSQVFEPNSNIEIRSLLLTTECPALVVFTAAWSGPCRAMTPVLEQLATSRGPELLVLRVNVSELKELAQEIGVKCTPTMALMRGTRVLASRVGVTPLWNLQRFIDDVLGGEGSLAEEARLPLDALTRVSIALRRLTRRQKPQ